MGALARDVQIAKPSTATFAAYRSVCSIQDRIRTANRCQNVFPVRIQDNDGTWPRSLQRKCGHPSPHTLQWAALELPLPRTPQYRNPSDTVQHADFLHLQYTCFDRQ